MSRIKSAIWNPVTLSIILAILITTFFPATGTLAKPVYIDSTDPGAPVQIISVPDEFIFENETVGDPLATFVFLDPAD